MTNTKKYVGGDRKMKPVVVDESDNMEDEDNYIPTPADYERIKNKKEVEENKKNQEGGFNKR